MTSRLASVLLLSVLVGAVSLTAMFASPRQQATAQTYPSPTATPTMTSPATPTVTITATSTRTSTATPTTAVATPTTPVATQTATTTSPACSPITGSTTVQLTGAEENPPVSPTDAVGTFSFRLDGSTLTYRLQATGTALVAAHLHLGAKGTNGPVVVPFFANSAGLASVDLCGTVTESMLSGSLAGNLAGFVTALQSGNIYANVHTAAHPGGAVRGQLPGSGPVTPPIAPRTGSGLAQGSSIPPYLPLACLVTVLALLGATGAIGLARRR